MTGRLGTRATVNIVLGVVATVLAATALYLEVEDRSEAVSPTITTTTSTTSTTTTTFP